MENNGIIVIYDENIGEIKEYLTELENFSNDIGKECLKRLRKEKPYVYKGYSDGQKKNYRNWQNGNNIPERSGLIKLCFDYEIRNLEEINNLLYAFNHEALHMRSVEDLCYYFALTHSIPYEEAEKKAKEQKAEFEKMYGEESGESKRTSTGLYTRMVIEEVNSAHTWQELEDYIKENSSRLGRIKVTAYKKLKEFADELEEEDKAKFFENTGEKLPYQKLVDNVRSSMGCPKADKKSGFFTILNRTEPIGRGVYIMYFIKTYFNNVKRRNLKIDMENMISDLNKDLDKCSFAPLNPERCLWDKIVYDSIEASLDLGLWYDEEESPYDLLRRFLDCIQEPEI